MGNKSGKQQNKQRSEFLEEGSFWQPLVGAPIYERIGGMPEWGHLQDDRELQDLIGRSITLITIHQVQPLAVLTSSIQPHTPYF